MSNINNIYEAIDVDGFSKSTLHLIDEYINDIDCIVKFKNTK